MKLTTAQARRLMIHCQGLDGRWKLPRGKEGAARAVERLGHVQIDTIAVVERAHHHIISSRCPDYTPRTLDDLLAADRRVFEAMTRCAVYLPMCDYRYYRPGMEAFAAAERTRRFRKEYREHCEHVLERVDAEGPLRSADFESPEGKRGSWWDWKPAKRALEVLFQSGELMIAARHNFQRLYDRTERVLPAGLDTSPPSAEETARFRIRRGLTEKGFADEGHILWRRGQPEAFGEALAQLVDSGDVVSVTVEGFDEPMYALAADVETIKSTRLGKPRCHILSPFDGLVIDRSRVRSLFGFDYRLECYHPPAKRRWGYFCLPILWGTEFIGRLDPKADRKARTLIIRKLLLEAECPDLSILDAALRDYAAFNDCDSVIIEECTPRKLLPALRRHLA